MPPYTLRDNTTKDDESWRFTVPQENLVPSKRHHDYGKFIKFTAQSITLDMTKMPSNRILHGDDRSKFILVSFSDLRFPETSMKTTADYINRLMKAGLFLNGIQYRFYHHSNSQLRGLTCFLRQANTDAELDTRIYRLGSFENIMNAAKRAKRIGLLFSAASIDYQLDPKWTTDICDIKSASGDEIFSDGCGLISRNLAVQLARTKKIIFRGSRYTPCVFQIRYLGYKGVLMLHPELDQKPQKKEDDEKKAPEKKYLVKFRKSMKKFSTTSDITFSVVDYSRPYAFGRLNNDIIVLLSSLGITNDKLLAKQEEYFRWIAGASDNVTQAIDFLSCMAQDAFDQSVDRETSEIQDTLVENVLLKGFDDPSVAQKIRRFQMSEIANFRNLKNDKPRSRMMIHKSRLIFGVCDPFKVLKEGQVHIRITTARGGPATPIHGDVLVVRNPCLHPGDCLKLRAVSHGCLTHLVDCIVFAAVARPGHHAAPAMSSGGDLDGDKYFVCWDPDLVPSRLVQSYDYPANKEHVSKKVTRADMANHFAQYNNSGLAKVALLHSKWVQASPEGALSSQCQELNALHSQSVDGARIKIPDRLLTPPEPTTPFILDLLSEAAADFAEQFTQTSSSSSSCAPSSTEEAQHLILQLLKSQQNAVSEFELFNMAQFLARSHSLDIRPYLMHIDTGALTTEQKYVLSSTLSLSPQQDLWLWNSLSRSDILTARDLFQKELDRPYSLQRLYSSVDHGLTTFFEYLRRATQEYARTLLILKTDERFAIGIFMRGKIPWDEDPEVANNVVVCPFMPQTSSTLMSYKPCSKGYRLHCSENNFQLYNKHRGDTFVFITRPPVASGAEVATSIALQKISGSVQRQLGRLNRTPVVAIELHVISNRDRVAHQLFDLWFEHVPTEERCNRLDNKISSYMLNNMNDVDWHIHPTWLKQLFVEKQSEETMHDTLVDKSAQELDQVMGFSLKYHAKNELFWTFKVVILRDPFPTDRTVEWIERWPPLVFVLLKAYPPDEQCLLPLKLQPIAPCIIQNLVRCANNFGIACLVGLEKISASVAALPMDLYLELLMLTALCVRPQQLVQEFLLVLHECREIAKAGSYVMEYAHRHALAVAFDRAEEAADECPCDDTGKPKKQRMTPTRIKLLLDSDPVKHLRAIAHVRVDARTTVRLHSHVRLQPASMPEKGWVELIVLDGVVTQATTGELKIDLMYPPPPEMERMDWKMYNAGSIATSKAMMDALQRLVEEGVACCGFSRILTDPPDSTTQTESPNHDPTLLLTADANLNFSQLSAVKSCSEMLSLIWGPPGTGKTTVVVQILRRMLQNGVSDEFKILMTASTHNAVDNVLKRFIELNKKENLLKEDQILRIATDHSKVDKSLQHFTVDARVGGDTNENNHLVRKAIARVKPAVIVFTTCAGAGLGVLRTIDFDTVLIDEASQLTEPCTLIPLVKGCQRAILVGDHVQLRPMVRQTTEALQFDVSLLERLYTRKDSSGLRRTMLNVQYRFPKELADFPSREFYEAKLQSAIQDSAKVLKALESTNFPWPRSRGVIVPTIFVQCSDHEDEGGRSKSNEGQARLVAHIQEVLRPESNNLDVTVLTPYKKQVQVLKNHSSSSIPCSTIDSFQGRESDIIIFSTVRCNVAGDIGFVEDARRLNVMWTRARLALIIVGDRRTMSDNGGLWKRAIEACTEVPISFAKPAGDKDIPS